MSTFADTGLSPELLRGIETLGFTEPTPIQAKVIPLLLHGKRDVVALAQTGTGKTAAFGLPLLQLTDPAVRAVQALVLCPTRELCLQITRDLESFSRHATHLRVVAVYGGASMRAQGMALRQGAHILVATPGRLLDFLRRGEAKLDQVRRVVLDEADEMLSMGFQEDLEAILAAAPDTARTLLFSATMPRAVAAIATAYLDDPEEIVVTTRNAGATRIEHRCHVVHARDRYAALRRLLDSNPDLYGIIFCRTRAETQEIAAHLAADGYPAEALHGDLSQDQRDRVMRGFRARALRVLVATDVAARGIDVQDLTHVIHFDLPGDPDVYTHRSGRTGRAGKAGVSVVLAHLREERKVREIERALGKPFALLPVPSGREVIEARVARYLAELPSAPPEPGPIREFLPRLAEGFQAWSREEILAHFLEQEFGPVLKTHLNAPDLNARSDRPRASGPAKPRHPRDEAPAGEFVTLRVNLGRRNGFNPATLITLINRATPGPQLPIGRIRVTQQDTLVEVPESALAFLIPNLNRVVYYDRPVRVVVERGGRD
jgi:ATP-dependent RNA helicase DeaD